MRRFLILLSVVALVVALAAPATASITTPNGTWTAYPGQSTAMFTAIQAPINADGSSNYKYQAKGVVPVKFELSTGTGPFVMESIWSDNTATYPYTGTGPCGYGTATEILNDCSYLTFRPTTHPLMSDVTELSAIYDFFDGDCAGGSLRWRMYLADTATGSATRAIDIHYQPGDAGIGLQYCQVNTSGADLTESTEPIVVTYLGGSVNYNITYAEALTHLGTKYVTAASLQLDSGWGANGDQAVTLGSATFKTNGYSDTFTPEPPSATARTCDLPTDAQIKITKMDGNATGPVNEDSISVDPSHDDYFRVVDCKLMYNLLIRSLTQGTGTYKIEAVIDGDAATGAALIDLR